MLGTDQMFSSDGEVQGAGPRKFFTMEEQIWFYRTHWRYFQTWNTQFDHPTQIQGSWNIDGVGFEKEVL